MMRHCYRFTPPPISEDLRQFINDEIERVGMKVYGDTHYDSMDQRYPQEIAEPSPAPSWWRRFMGWLG